MTTGLPTELLIEALPLLETEVMEGYAELKKLVKSLEENNYIINELFISHTTWPIDNKAVLEIRLRSTYALFLNMPGDKKLILVITALVLITARKAQPFNLIEKDSLIYSLFDLIAKKYSELDNVK